MFRSSRLLVLIFALTVASAAQYTGATTNAQSTVNTPHCVVSGVVVNSVTGESLPRAQVSMYGPEVRTTLTDSDGHFTFEDVAQAMVGFQAHKPGFKAPNRRVDFRVQTCTANTSDEVKVALAPTAAIIGRVTDANGDPVDEVPIRIGKYVFTDGRKHFSMAGSSSTDYDGKFRVADLDAGSYILIAGPSSPGLMIGARDITPISYYPGVPDRASAAPIEAKPGARVEVNLTVNEVAAFNVSGRVVGASSEARGVSIEFKNDAGDDVGTAVGRRDPNGFMIIGVPAGTYRARATVYEREGVLLTGSATITVAHDVDNLQIPVAGSLNIPVNIRTEGFDSGSSDTNPSASLRLMSTREDDQGAFMSFAGNKKGWWLRNVERGTYIAEVSANSAGYIASARLGPVDLLREPVTVDSDQNPIEITVRNDGAQLSGTIAGGSQALIVAISSDGVLIPPRAGAYSQNGSPKFQMYLAPGDYTVYAMDPEGIEYTNPKVMEKYASYGVHVSLASQDKKEIKLTKIEVTQ
jgi:hypothetical protein